MDLGEFYTWFDDFGIADHSALVHCSFGAGLPPSSYCCLGLRQGLQCVPQIVEIKKGPITGCQL